ncbi:uncharacterized protein LOC115243600 [Formica exsecta]|uniref:uncharacterized protein LOC115243600 n=1 Tax=Formica exsecta TaxID=72781 RepID=UPI001142545D|nr:uncharacterized protein LOC115243600 [Formica exsecta]
MYRFKYVIVVTFWWIIATTGNIVQNEDICGSHNGRRLYLELGEKGILYAKNVSFIKNSPRQLTSRLYSTTITNGSHHQCSLELVTCPSCVIVVTFKNIALSHHCGDGVIVMDSPCRCDYVWLSEPPYEDVSGTPFCGSYTPITYRSSTRTLSINLFYSQSHKHAFTIEYTAERNRLHLKGTEMTSGAPTKGLNGTTGNGILTSPFFPARYPRDLGLEYVITCPTEAPSCRIRLLFSDFQLATVSIMEFYDWNGQRLDVSSGARFRPPIIVSSGPSLLVRFYANGGTGLGYKAFYSFVIGHTYDKSIQPITDCGGYVENLGGAITMMNMVGQGVKIYDCVWLIRPPKNFLHMKTHMYLKVVAFADMAGNTELIIKEGPTSALMSLEVIRHPSSQLQSFRHREHITPVTSGFHVSLRGTFGPNSHLAIAYAAFSYINCFADTDFLCQNHRCIPNQLNCDGFDHCGDNSDEPATCFQNWEMEPRERKWHMNKANYYFPKIEQYPDLKTATLVFVASSLGLIILITTLIILLYRIGGARQRRELQSRLETISELLGMRLFDEDATSSTYLVVEGANNSSSRQTTPVASENDRRALPESPPPPYITPPGTILRNMNLAGLSASMKQMCPIRRNWLRRSAQYPQSSSDDRSSSSTDAETLDTYLTDCTVPDTNCRLKSPPKEDHIVSETVQENTVEVLKANSQHVTEEKHDEDIDRTSDRSDERNASCSCEGACGCVIECSNVQDHSASNISISATPISDNCELECDQTAIASSSAEKIDDHQEEDFSLSKSTVVRILGSKLMKPLYHSANSTAASSPCGTLHHSCRRFSRDSCVTKISTISPCSSYDKLQDDFEIVSEAASSLGCTTNSSTMANTPSGTPKSVVGQRSGRSGNGRPGYTSCDLDSLYEGIKILDLYLARRNINVSHGHRQSVAVMLFGTPEHGPTRHPVATPRQITRERHVRARIWRSSEDASSN